MTTQSVPKVFISYSWDSDDHRKWVRDFATRLRTEGGVDVTLDQWHAVPGDQLPQFMAKAVRESDFVLLVCTPNYKTKSNGGTGGVGYEGDIMTSEVLTKQNHRKFIPILRHDDWSSAAPSWVAGKYYIKLAGDPYSKEAYLDLLQTLHGKRASAPPIGGGLDIGSEQPDLLAASKDILDLANEILQSNQNALVPLFQNPARRYSVGLALTGLYHQQEHRSKFTEWQAYLQRLANASGDAFEQSACERLLHEVNNLYMAFYTYERSLGDKGESEITKHLVELVLGNRGADPQWYCLGDSEVVRIAEHYLENVRGAVERIGSIVGELRAVR
jgi:hypothetical protein